MFRDDRLADKELKEVERGRVLRNFRVFEVKKRNNFDAPLCPLLKLWGLWERSCVLLGGLTREHGAGHFHSSQRQVLSLLTQTIHSSFSHRCNQTQAKIVLIKVHSQIMNQSERLIVMASLIYGNFRR
jgi:hypothetical protein